jgi:hypothetical protein
MLRRISALLLILSGCPLLMGQLIAGTITGTLTDSSSAIVPGASIQVEYRNRGGPVDSWR